MSSQATIYTVGGTVQAGSGLYISRHSDDELRELCLQGAFAYVLAPRQLGKSSLMVRTAERLQEEGILSVILDLTQLGVQVTAEAWYLGLLTMVEDNLMLDTDVVNWWQAHSHLGNAQRLVLFFQDLILTKLEQPLVIFVDEIDTTLSLNFTDDFYAAVRSLYVARARIPELKRLSFVLIGVASPGDLIRDPRRTPFNIGRRVDMADFSLAEALPLAEGLAGQAEEQRSVLGWVFKWTGGHPYLTQRLCRMLAEQGPAELSEAGVDRVVRETFLGEKSFQDNNLQFVRDMLIRQAENTAEVLMTYQAVRRGKRAVQDEEQSIIKSHLKLSGVVKTQGKNLTVRNLIYRTVFNEEWIKEHLPVNWARRLRQALGVIAASLALALVMGGLAVYALAQQGTANERAAEAIAARGTAEARRVEAEKSREESERQGRVSKAQALAAGSLAQLETDPERSILLGVEAVRLAGQPGLEAVRPQANDALRRALEQARLNRPPLTAHTGIVNSAAFSPDGRYFVTASNDGTAIVWETSSGRAVSTLKGHSQWVTGATFSPDGRSVLTASNDSTVRIWEALTGREIVIIKRQDQAEKKDVINDREFISAAFSPDGRYVLTAGSDNQARLWESAGGRELAVLSGHSAGLNSAAFSPDGRLAVTAGADGTARLWDIPSGQLRYILAGHTAPLNGAAFSPDGRQVVTAANDFSAIVYDTGSGQALTTLKGHTSVVAGVSFSPDGRLVATASLDGSARLWEVASGKETAALKGHTARVLEATFSPDGRQVVTASWDRTARVWDTASGKVLYTLNGHSGNVISATFSPDGQLVVTTSDDGTVRLWEALSGQELTTFQGHSAILNGAVFSPDGLNILTASQDQTARIWEVQSRRQLLKLAGHSDWLTSASYSPDGRLVVTTSRDNTARIWEASSGKELVTLKGHLNTVSGAAFSPDGRQVITAGQDQTARLWDSRTGQELLVLKGHANDLTGAAFGPDGSLAVTTSLDGTARLWALPSGQELITLKGHEGAVNRAAFGPDGQYIVTAGRDETARLWNRQTGQAAGILKGHSGWVNSAAFSPDGRYIVTAGADGTTRVWEMRAGQDQGQEIATLKRHQGGVSSAAFGPDGKYIVSAGLDGAALTHIFAPDELLRVAGARLTRQLTAEERVQFGLDPATVSATAAAAATSTPAASPTLPAPAPPSPTNAVAAQPSLTIAVAAATALPAAQPPGKVDLIEELKLDNTGKKGGQLTVACCEPATFQPYFDGCMLCNQVNASLVGYNYYENKYYPYLLASIPTLENGGVRVAADGRSMDVTLKLKPGLKWSDGSPLTSKDLAFTIRWINDPDNQIDMPGKSTWQLITGVDTPDSSTAVLKFKQVYGPYINLLCCLYPLPEKVWSRIPVKNQAAARSAEALRPTVTSGPFKLEEFVEGSRVVLARNEHFGPVWGFNAYLDKVIFVFNDPDPLSSFARGQQELLLRSPFEPAVDISSIPGSRLAAAPPNNREAVKFNLTNPLFQDKAVRKALELALDKQALINLRPNPQNYRIAGNYFFNSPFIHRGLQPAPYDPAGAKKLLDTAGWQPGPDGIRVKAGRRLAFGLSTLALRLTTAQAVVAQWRAIGADVTFQALTPPNFFGIWNQNGVLARGNFDTAIFANQLGVEPEGRYFYYHSSQIPSQANQTGGNYGRLRDPQIDRALDEQRTTADQSRRLAAALTIQQALEDNTYEIPLYDFSTSQVVNSRVKNFKPSTEDGFWNIVEIYLEPAASAGPD